MSSNEIRLRVPAGEVYLPALVEGATKIGARRGLSGVQTGDFGAMVHSAAVLATSASPASVELVVTPQADKLRVVVAPHGPTQTADAALVRACRDRAAALAHVDGVSIDATAGRVDFDVDLS